MRPERAAEDGEGVVDVVTVPVEVDEGAGGVVLVYVAGEGAETFGGFDLLIRRCERRWREGRAGREDVRRMSPIALNRWKDGFAQSAMVPHAERRGKQRTLVPRNIEYKSKLRQLRLEPHKQFLVHRAARIAYQHQVRRFDGQLVLVCAFARAVELEVEVGHDLDLHRC